MRSRALSEVGGLRPVAEKAEDAKAGLKAIDEHIALRNAGAAQTSLDTLQAETTEKLLTAAREWAKATKDVLLRLEGDPGDRFPAEAPERLHHREELRNSLDPIETVTSGELRDGLRNAMLAEPAIETVLAEVTHIGQKVSEAVPDELASLRDPDHVRSLKALALALEQGRDNLANATAAAERVGVAIDRTLVNWLTALGDKAPAEAEEALEEARYLAALRFMTKEELAPIQDAADERLLGGETDGEGVVVTKVVDEVSEKERTPVPGREDVLAATTPTARALRVVLWVMALVSLLGVVYVALPQAMVGTFVQQLGVFVWAASLTPTYDGLTGQLGKLAPGPK